jgi:hypothetical protein
MNPNLRDLARETGADVGPDERVDIPVCFMLDSCGSFTDFHKQYSSAVLDVMYDLYGSNTGSLFSAINYGSYTMKHPWISIDEEVNNSRKRNIDELTRVIRHSVGGDGNFDVDAPYEMMSELNPRGALLMVSCGCNPSKVERAVELVADDKHLVGLVHCGERGLFLEKQVPEKILLYHADKDPDNIVHNIKRFAHILKQKMKGK